MTISIREVLNDMPSVLSLFDYSGVWSDPWYSAGYSRLRVDLSLPEGLYRKGRNDFDLGLDLSDGKALDLLLSTLWVIGVPDVILAAPPCGCFTRASAWLWSKMDDDGRTGDSLRLVDTALSLVDRMQPTVWALENPPGRLWNPSRTCLRENLGVPKMKFDPWQFGAHAPEDPTSRMTKKTYVWGNFNVPVWSPHPDGKKEYPAHLPPRRRDPIRQMGSRNKRERERTPPGFAKAFFLANRLPEY